MIPQISREDLEQHPYPRAFIRELFSCHHPDALVTKRKTISGWYQRVLQCQCCGGQLSRPMTDDEKRTSVEGLPDFNPELGVSWVRAETDDYDIARKINQERHPSAGLVFTPEYQAYLNTPECRLRRDAVLKRDKYSCQSCGTRRAEQAHHLTYRHLFKEPLFDLVAVCTFCHYKLLHDRPES